MSLRMEPRSARSLALRFRGPAQQHRSIDASTTRQYAPMFKLDSLQHSPSVEVDEAASERPSGRNWSARNLSRYGLGCNRLNSAGVSADEAAAMFASVADVY